MRKVTISVVSFGFLLLFASAIPPAMAQSDSAEISFWESVRDSKSPAELEAYLKAYPHGKFSTLARIRLKKLKSGSHVSTKESGPTENRPAKQAGREKPPVTVKWQEKTMSVTLGSRGKRASLGIAIQPPTAFSDRGKGAVIGFRDESKGAIIRSVVPGGPAESAGLQFGDIILQFDGHAVGGFKELAGLVSKTPPGKKVALVIVRPDIDDAIRQYRALADKGEADAAASLSFLCYGRALTYRNKKDYDRAIADFDEAIRLYPKHVLAYNSRGSTYQAKGAYDRAIADYSEAIRLNPKFAEAYINRGLAYAIKKDYDRAIANLSDAVRLNPAFARAYSLRAFAYEHVRRKAEAIADYRKALLLDPSNKAATEGLTRLGAKPF